MNLKVFLKLSFLLISVSLMGQTGKFKIFGTVYNTDKMTVADWPVIITASPNTVPVKILTDLKGNYEHSFEVNTNARIIYKVSVSDPCQLAPLVQDAVAKVGEERHDFVICAKNTPPSNPCDGKFESIVHTDGWVEFHAAPEIRDAKYLWDFGDGTSDEGKDVRHQYASEGVYVVVLTIVTTSCKSQYKSKVEVKRVTPPPPPPPTTNFGNSCCGKVNISATATNSGSSLNGHSFSAGADFKIIDVSWDFGDGSRGSGENTRHTYAKEGKYKVITTIKGEYCTVILTTWIHVTNVTNPPPPKPCNIDFSFSISDLSAKFSADFKGQRPDKFAWDFGDGNSSSDAATSHTYARAGEYKVTLTASINGQICQITKVIKVGTKVDPPKGCDIDFAFGVSNLSAKFQADFKGQKADKMRWDFGDGNSSGDAGTSHTYAKAGEYKVTLTASINGKTCQITKVIKVGNRGINPNNNIAIVIYDVSPNPATDATTVFIKSDIKANVTLLVADIANNTLIKQEIGLEIGDNQVPMKLANLRPGTYVVYINYDNKPISRSKFQKL